MQQTFHHLKKKKWRWKKNKDSQSPGARESGDKRVQYGSETLSTNYQSLLARPLSFSAIGLVRSFLMLFWILGARQAFGTGLPPTGPVLD